MIDEVVEGDCREWLPSLAEDSIDAIVTDPPYFLLDSGGKGFMGKEWESLNRKKSIDIVCRSKEFARFVESITLLLKVESSMEGGNSVLQNASMPGQSTIESNSIAPCVEKSLKENQPMLKANTNSVQGIVLTKAARLGLLKGLSQNHITAIGSQPENALFAVPILFIESLIKKHAPRSVSISMPKQADGSKDQEILLTLMEDQRIKNVIAVMSGKTCESSFMPETSIDARSVISTADTMKYRLITSEDIKNPLIMEWLIWLLYAIDAMSRSSTTGKTLTDFLNSDLVYQFHKQWAEEAIRVLKPGGHLLSFGGTRSYHTMARAIEDAGFEIRDMLEWVYGSGFPKSLDISKALDKMAGAEREVIGKGQWESAGRQRSYGDGNIYGTSPEDRSITAPATAAAKQWAGWGSALKPAHEPICLARKPLDGCTIAENVIRWGVGGLNIDGCRVEGNARSPGFVNPDPKARDMMATGNDRKVGWEGNNAGRFPANLILSMPEDSYDDAGKLLANPGKDAVMRLFPETKSGGGNRRPNGGGDFFKGIKPWNDQNLLEPSSGSAARFFQQCPITEEDYLDTCALCNKLLYHKHHVKSEVLSWNVNGAEKNLNQETEIAGSVVTPALQQQPLESAGKLEKLNISANNAENHLLSSQETSEFTAPRNVNPNLTERIAQNVRSAANLCDSCETAIVQSIVAMLQGRDPVLHLGSDCISERKRQILTQCLALYAAVLGKNDTIPTIPSLKMWFGYVSYAIGDCTLQERTAVAENGRVAPIPLIYRSKASRSEREKGLDGMPLKNNMRVNAPRECEADKVAEKTRNFHPTVKPLALMRYLCRLITPPGGLVLDPFGGSGTTALAAIQEGFHYLLIEQQPEYCEIARKRIAAIPTKLSHWSD
jgi:DNA modification methylase